MIKPFLATGRALTIQEGSMDTMETGDMTAETQEVQTEAATDTEMALGSRGTEMSSRAEAGAGMWVEHEMIDQTTGTATETGIVMSEETDTETQVMMNKERGTGTELMTEDTDKKNNNKKTSL